MFDSDLSVITFQGLLFPDNDHRQYKSLLIHVTEASAAFVCCVQNSSRLFHTKGAGTILCLKQLSIVLKKIKSEDFGFNSTVLSL